MSDNVEFNTTFSSSDEDFSPKYQSFVEMQGPPGLSAYEIAVENGYKGTEKEWVESLPGKDGYTPRKDIDYFDGKDGYSPTAKVEETETGVAITITDETSTTTAEVKNGTDGYTPKKGIDYFDGEDGYTPIKGKDYFDGEDGEDATIKVGVLGNMKEVPELNIVQVTEEEYKALYEAGNLDPDAVYVTPEGEYAPLNHTHSASEIGALPTSGGKMNGGIDFSDTTNPIDFGTVGWIRGKTVAGGKFDIFGYSDPSTLQVGGTYPALVLKGKNTRPTYNGSDVALYSDINAHNTATDAHNDIRLLIQDITTQLANFLDVDDTTVDQLSEVLTLINNNKGTLESLTTSKINVSAIVDNLTTSDSTKVLSAKQGVAIKTLIDALQTAVDGKALASDLTSHTENKDNPHGVTASQVGALPIAGGTMTGPIVISGGDAVSGKGNIQLDSDGQITAKGTNSTLFGRTADDSLYLGHSSHNLTIRGKASRPTYNGSNMALQSDVPSTTETWTFTLEDGSTVTKEVYVK